MTDFVAPTTITIKDSLGKTQVINIGAATDGTPPIPIDPPVTGSPRDKLLAYLEQCSAPDRCLFGQTSFPDQREFNEVANTYGFAPAIMFNDPWVVQWAGNAPYDGSFIGAQLQHCREGGIAGMSLMLPNPANNANSTDGAHVDPVQLLTPGTALNNRLNANLDLAAGLLQQHMDAGNAVPTRYLFELDGPWFWWGYGKFTGPQQTQLYGYITHYLRVTKHLDNLVTEFAINGGPNTYEYPGDDVVDMVGIDAYTNNLAGTYKSKYDKLRQQAPNKLFCMTEYGSGDPNGPDPNFDLTRLKADLQSALPRCCLVNFWSGWQPTKQKNGHAAMSDPFHINKAQVALP